MQKRPPREDLDISVGFISLGCAKNLVDTQLMAGTLLTNRVKLAPRPEEADVILVNTCSFIETARQESIEAIHSACEMKSQGRCRAVVVAGCYAQRYRERLKSHLPEVDAFIGLEELEQLALVIRRLAEGERGIVEVSATSRRVFEPKVPSLVFTGGPYAYVKIAEGCNHRCGFCAIPGIRGAYRSRPIGKIVREAETLLESGIRELNLISQDVTFYGQDLGPRTSLPALLQALAKIGGRFWVRLLYGYPAHVSDELLETMAAIPQMCRYLDVPIQHSHPDILRAMQRADTVSHVETLVVRARAVMPDISLRTTCLVGFPGETDTHFQHLLDYLQRNRLDHVGAFTFSPEEGTPAAALPARPAPEEAEERCARLMREQASIVKERARARVGKEEEVLLERPHAEGHTVWIARSRREAPEADGEIFVEKARAPRTGTFCRVRHIEALDYDMRATAAERPTTRRARKKP